MYTKELVKNLRVCISCGYHHPMSAPERIACLLDEGTFHEYDRHLLSKNPLDFPQYMEKIEEDREKTKLNEAVVTGEGTINGFPVVIAVMDSRFRMGSMGSVVGEKLHAPSNERWKISTFYYFYRFRWSAQCKKVY